MSYILFTILLLVSPAAAMVDCSIACRRCQERNESYPDILEVYCAMCRECQDRRSERLSRLSRRDLDAQAVIYDLQDQPEDCPTAPPCESDLEQVPPFTLAATITTTTTTTTTEATPRRPCPAAPPCQKRGAAPAPRCLPCLPMCPCPLPARHSPTTARVQQLAVESSTTLSPGHLYVYIGVPKEMLEKIKQ